MAKDFLLPSYSHFLPSQTIEETRTRHVNTHSQAQQCSQQLFNYLNVIFFVFLVKKKKMSSIFGLFLVNQVRLPSPLSFYFFFTFPPLLTCPLLATIRTTIELRARILNPSDMQLRVGQQQGKKKNLNAHIFFFVPVNKAAILSQPNRSCSEQLNLLLLSFSSFPLSHPPKLSTKFSLLLVTRRGQADSPHCMPHTHGTAHFVILLISPAHPFLPLLCFSQSNPIMRRWKEFLSGAAHLRAEKKTDMDHLSSIPPFFPHSSSSGTLQPAHLGSWKPNEKHVYKINNSQAEPPFLISDLSIKQTKTRQGQG